MRRALLSVGFLALALAQSKFPLEVVRVTGNQRIPAEKIVAVLGLKTGAQVDKADFDAARAKLLATGAFGNDGYEFKPGPSNKGYEATFDVVEIEQLFPYHVEDLPVPEETIRAELRKREPLFGEEIPGTIEVLTRLGKEVEQIANTKIT